MYVEHVTTPTVEPPSRPLPRGPHRLSREEVRRSQKDRLLAAATAAVAAKGYVATSVADIHTRAGVSRATFYQLFDDKLDCFLAACEMATGVIAAVLTEELDAMEADGVTEPLERLSRLLGTYLTTLAELPDLARVFLVEVYAAGPDAIRQRRDALEGFADLVAVTHDGEGGLLGTAERQRFAAEVLVGAVSSMVTNAVGVGDTSRLAELHGPLMEVAASILTPGAATPNGSAPKDRAPDDGLAAR